MTGMTIKLDTVRIQNFRSIRDLTIQLGDLSLLFGKNDSGKSNILHAIKLAFTNTQIEESDVYVSEEYPSAKDKSVIVDVKFVPTYENGNSVNSFNDSWGLHLGSAIAIDNDDKEFFAYRTEFVYDCDKETYVRSPRQAITQWADDIVPGDNIGFETLSAFDFIFLDAHRDIAEEIANRNSRWNKELSKIKVESGEASQLEEELIILGDKIVGKSTFLTKAQEDLKLSVDESSTTKINPISRNISEIYKGLDIFIQTNGGTPLPISNYGSGTKSRAVFATYKTLIDSHSGSDETKADSTPYYCLVAFEEPESHIHPNAQKKLVVDFERINAQRILTTHSPYLLTTSDLNNFIYVSKNNNETICKSFSNLELDAEGERHIKQSVLNTRGDIFFSSKVVLVEGETEEIAFPLFYKENYGKHPFEMGVNIICVGGHNYRQFIKMCDFLDIDWYVFSDGEERVVDSVARQVKEYIKMDETMSNRKMLNSCPNIVLLNEELNFETYLIDEGYQDEIIASINEVESKNEEHHSETYFDWYCKKHNGDEGRTQALKDCMKNGKTKYAAAIARKIIECSDEDRKIPGKIMELFNKMNAEIDR